MAERLIVEYLDDETLVYDTERNEAHCLGGDAVAQFDAAGSDVSRREVIRRIALVGATAVGASPLIRTIVAPAPAQAASGTPCGTGGLTCTAGQTCCNPTGNPGNPGCCNTGTEYCTGVVCVPCGSAGQLCCNPGITNTCSGGSCCGSMLICVANGSLCIGAGPCCNGTCCAFDGCCDSGTCVAAGGSCPNTGGSCSNGTCQSLSDRNLKHHLAPVEPQGVLAAVGL